MLGRAPELQFPSSSLFPLCTWCFLRHRVGHGGLKRRDNSLHGAESAGLRLLHREQTCFIFGLVIHLVYSISFVICGREEKRASDMMPRPFST